MKILVALLFVASLALNVFQRIVQTESNEIIALQAVAIEADKTYWDKISVAEIPVWKNPKTGDIYVGVPYREKPVLYPKVCAPELHL